LLYNKFMTQEKLTAILKQLRYELAGILGKRLEAVYLYGSQARGDARSDSDIDVLIVIRGDFDYFKMLESTSYPAWKLSLENDIVISRVFVSKAKFNQVNTPFLMNVHQEAVLI